MSACTELNKIPLPLVKPASGLRIPHDRSNFLQTNYKLRTDLVMIELLILYYFDFNGFLLYFNV